MESLVLVLHVLVAVAMIALILLQQGKGAEMGASFGAGASQTVFGAAGSAGFLTKATAVLAAIFFVTSLGLAIYAKKNAQGFGLVPEVPVEHAADSKPASDVPVVPAAQAPAAGGDVPAVPAK